MYVREVMTTTVHTIHFDSSFREVVEFLIQHQISGAPVVDNNNHLVGVLSEKDLFHHLFPSQEEFYKDLPYWINHLEEESHGIVAKKAKDLITRKVISITPNEHVIKACALLLIHGIRRLPVVESEDLVGIVTTNDLYRNFLQKSYLRE